MNDPRPEFALIDWISRTAGNRKEVVLGIGDDAAILGVSDQEWVITKDVLIEDVHFDSTARPHEIGYKSLAVNLSDLAAMTAIPVAAFVGIVIPKGEQQERIQGIFQGLQALADDWNVTLAGGDTNSSSGPLVISVTLIGTVEPGTAVRRDRARPGDWIFVTGPLGGSLAQGRHFRFTPRIREALLLKEAVSLHSMMDISDGIGSDLFHLLNRSQVGAKLIAAQIPVHPDVDSNQSAEQRLQQALSDGEDFELLFTVSPEDGAMLLENPPAGMTPFHIGEITAEREVLLIHDDRTEPLVRSGWSHSFGQSAQHP